MHLPGSAVGAEPARIAQRVVVVDATFAAQQSQLRFDARSREVLAVLSGIRLPVPMAGLSRELFLGAGAALLPDWAEAMLERTSLQRMQAAASARMLAGMSPLFRRALTDGTAQRACTRMGVTMDAIRHR